MQDYFFGQPNCERFQWVFHLNWTFLFPGYNVWRCWIWVWYYRPRHCKHDHDCKAVWFLVYRFHYIVCTVYPQCVFHVQSLYVVPSFPLMFFFSLSFFAFPIIYLTMRSARNTLTLTLLLDKINVCPTVWKWVPRKVMRPTWV